MRCFRFGLVVFAVLACGLATGVAGKDKVALVLSGGGAKGAYQLGVLEHLCNTTVANSWDMVAGTSIGALAAGLLAQFNKDELCTKGLGQMAQFWESVKTPDDVYKSTSSLSTGVCTSSWNAVSLVSSFYKNGGLCDPEPGTTHYTQVFDAAAVRASNMELVVPAANMRRIDDAQWFTDQSDYLLDGVLASAAIAPLIFPRQVGDTFMVDGGVFHNTPLRKVLSMGATVVHVLFLTPIDNPNLNAYLSVETPSGQDVIQYYLHLTEYHMLIANELRIACTEYPNATIYGVVPSTTVGSLTEFYEASIASMRKAGQARAKETGLVDVCKLGGFTTLMNENHHDGSGVHVGSAVVGMVAGVVVGVVGMVVAMQWRSRRALVQARENQAYVQVQP